MEVDEIRSVLARIDWNEQFDQPTLKRANAYLRDGHLESLRFEPDRRGGGRLRALVRGSGGIIYEPWIEFRPDARRGLSVTSSCDCPVQGSCKHQALVLLHAQMHPPQEWPAPAPSASPPASPATVSPELLKSLPDWLRSAVGDQMPAPEVETLPAWDRWLSRLAATVDEEAAAPGETERRFGVILRELDGQLTVLPAWLRPGRGRSGGWVDPRAPVYGPDGLTPAPPGGWPDDDAIALGLLLEQLGSQVRKHDGVRIDSAPAEAAVAHLLARYPAYWRRGSVPLEAGPELPMQVQWEDQRDGSQRLIVEVRSNDEPTVLLRGHGLWYVQPQSRRWGRVRGDPRLLDLVEDAPSLLPEDAAHVSQQLQHSPELALALPRQRRLRAIQPRPVPLLVMEVVDVARSGRSRARDSLRIGAAGLYFEYDGHRLPAFAGEQTARVIDGDEILEIQRDRAFEETAKDQLQAHSLIDATLWSIDTHLHHDTFRPNQYLLRPDPERLPVPPDAWATVLRDLEADGFRIEYGPDFPRDDVVEIDAWKAEVDEVDNAWFDVSLGIEVEGKRIDLLPILRRLLVDPDFPLHKPADEPDDATWRVRLDQDRSVRLPMARLRGMLEPLLEWLLASEDGLRMHRTQAETLERVSEATALPWRGGERLRARIEQLRGAMTPATTPENFRAELRPYQRDGLAWLNFLADAGLGGILADDMGLGKTVQVLAHLVAEKNRGRLEKPALVVAPTSLVGNWRDEAARFAPDLRVLVLHGADRADRYEAIVDSDLVITTYPLLPRDRDSLCAQEFSILIFDEAQAIKNARSQAAQVVREIPAQRRLAMTGTPLENHLGELWAQFDAVEPGLLGSMTSFTRTYRTPIEKHGDLDRQARLNRRIGSLLLRRRKEDVLDDLPPKTESVRSLELAGGQRQLYETLRLTQHARVRESIAQRGLGQSGIVVLDALLKLRQACCDPRLVKLDAARKVKESVKLEALLELLQNLHAEGRRVLVFSQFAQMLTLISEALNKRRIKHLMLTGATPSGTRADLVRGFQDGEVPVFLISLKAGGVGLNLTAADAVIHYDPWWNPAVEAQATDRAHRIGQDKPVFVYKLICAGTVEEKIQTMQERKADLARAVLEGGSTTALRFDESDLAELFAPL